MSNESKPIARDEGNGQISVDFDGVLGEAKKIRGILLAQEFEGVRVDILHETGFCLHCGKDLGEGPMRKRCNCTRDD